MPRAALILRGGPLFVPIPGLEQGVIRRRPDRTPAPGAGILGPQGRVRLGDREGLLDDLIGFGGQLICREPVADRLGAERKGNLMTMVCVAGITARQSSRQPASRHPVSVLRESIPLHHNFGLHERGVVDLYYARYQLRVCASV